MPESQDTGENQDTHRDIVATEFTHPAEQLRPLMTKALIGEDNSHYLSDGYYFSPFVNGNLVKLTSYHTPLTRTYLERHHEGVSDPDWEREALKEGWGTITATFKNEPGDRDAKGNEISGYHYGFIVPREIDVWNPDIAAVLGIPYDTVLDIEEDTRNISPILTPEVLQGEIQARLTERMIELRKGILDNETQTTLAGLQAQLQRTGVDLHTPVVIAATYHQDRSNDGEPLVIGKRTEANTGHYTRLQALYDVLRNVDSYDVESTKFH